jgi:hypothetical protein
MRKAVMAATIVLVALTMMAPRLLGQAGAASTDKSYAGTWKLNVAKSKYQPGPGPKESTRVHEDRGGGFWLITTDSVNAQGQKTHGAYVYKPDGKQYPQMGLNQTTFNTIALTAVDPFTVDFTTYVDGKPTGLKGHRTLSKDGKTMTIEQKGTNAQGQATSSVAVWEKQ